VARQRRPPRTRLLGSEPAPIADLGARPGDVSVEDRVDGVSAKGDIRKARKRSGSTEPLPMSVAQWLEAIAVYAPLWELAAALELVAAHDGPGRQREATAAGVLLFEIASWETGSYRAAARALDDPWLWQRLTTAVADAWPNHPGRRLPAEAPSRSQHYRFRARHLEHDDALDDLRHVMRNVSALVATTVGMFDSSKGSLSHPVTANLITGDATWMPALYNTPGNQPVVDPETGEVVSRRADPDAVASHDGSQICGRNLVTVLARNPGGNERVILDLAFKPVAGVSDATVATDMALGLFHRLPAAAGVVYDMALHAADVDRILGRGRLPISKVQRTRGNRVASLNLGVHDFRLSSGANRSEIVVAVDGTPTITVPTGSGQYVVPLVRRQLKSRPNSNGGATVYGTWIVPAHPVVPHELRSAEVRVRHNSTDDELGRSKPRTRALRPIPETDADFSRLYGLREDTESMHHHLKQRLWNGRARCVGLKRQRINLHAYQLRTGIAALIAFHYRTGESIEAWFGAWRPPPSRRALAA